MSENRCLPLGDEFLANIGDSITTSGQGAIGEGTPPPEACCGVGEETPTLPDDLVVWYGMGDYAGENSQMLDYGGGDYHGTYVADAQASRNLAMSAGSGFAGQPRSADPGALTLALSSGTTTPYDDFAGGLSAASMPDIYTLNVWVTDATSYWASAFTLYATHDGAAVARLPGTVVEQWDGSVGNPSFFCGLYFAPDGEVGAFGGDEDAALLITAAYWSNGGADVSILAPAGSGSMLTIVLDPDTDSNEKGDRTGKMYLYCDGALAGEVDLEGDTSILDGQLSIGYSTIESNVGFNHPLRGSVDEVMGFGRPLKGDEIAALHGALQSQRDGVSLDPTPGGIGAPNDRPTSNGTSKDPTDPATFTTDPGSGPGPDGSWSPEYEEWMEEYNRSRAGMPLLDGLGLGEAANAFPQNATAGYSQILPDGLACVQPLYFQTNAITVPANDNTWRNLPFNHKVQDRYGFKRDAGRFRVPAGSPGPEIWKQPGKHHKNFGALYFIQMFLWEKAAFAYGASEGYASLGGCLDFRVLLVNTGADLVLCYPWLGSGATFPPVEAGSSPDGYIHQVHGIQVKYSNVQGELPLGLYLRPGAELLVQYRNQQDHPIILGGRPAAAEWGSMAKTQFMMKWITNDKAGTSFSSYAWKPS